MKKNLYTEKKMYPKLIGELGHIYSELGLLKLSEDHIF